MSDKKQRLVYSILEFLNQSIDDGTVKADDIEGLEVSIQCIGEAFGVNTSDAEQSEKLSVKPASLQSIFDVFLKTRDKVSSMAQPGPSISASSSTPTSPSPATKAEAEKLKQAGNAFISRKKYDDAIDSYNKAIALDSTNPVYYSNRAAAYSSKGDHLSAIGDAEQALAVDPKFIKAYHRLGHAQYSLGDFKAAADAFERGLALDPSNANLKSGLQNSQTRITAESSSRDEPTETTVPGTAGAALPDLDALSESMRNMGLSGNGGGMPDLSSFMNNPQLMSMASQLASNGGLANLMQDPAVANLMNRFQSGSPPSMADLMSDPDLRRLGEQFRGNNSNA